MLLSWLSGIGAIAQDPLDLRRSLLTILAAELRWVQRGPLERDSLPKDLGWRLIDFLHSAMNKLLSKLFANNISLGDHFLAEGKRRRGDNQTKKHLKGRQRLKSGGAPKRGVLKGVFRNANERKQRRGTHQEKLLGGVVS